MKVTFLGTSAATAMPLPFCNCNICKEAKRNKGKDIRKRASIVINDDMLIDLGPDSVNACYQYDINISNIKYVLQTHAHSDHFDAGHLITRHPEYAVKDINPVTVVASAGTLQAMNNMLQDEDGEADIFSKEFQEKLRISLCITSYNETITLGEYTITALNSLHDINQQSQIFLISNNNKTVLYGTDLLSIDVANSEYLCKHNVFINMLILDQTYGEGFNSGGHLDASQVIETIRKLKKSKKLSDNTLIYATHISHEGNHTHKKMQSLAHIHGYDIAYDGLVIAF